MKLEHRCNYAFLAFENWCPLTLRLIGAEVEDLLELTMASDEVFSFETLRAFVLEVHFG